MKYPLPWCTDIVQLKTAKGLALQDILLEVHQYVHRSKYQESVQYLLDS